MQGDTCPTEWYMSSGHSANCRLRFQVLTGWKLIFGYMVQWLQIHHTVKGCCSLAFRCAMYLLPLDHVSKHQLSTNQNLLNARADSRNVYWTCITLHSVLPLSNKSYQKHQIHACANFTYVHVFRSTHVGPGTYANKFAYWLLYIY